MKTRRVCFGLLAGALAMLLAACTPADPVPSPAPEVTATPVVLPTATPEPEATPTPQPAELPVWGNQVFARTFTAGDGTTVLSVSYSLPMVQNTQQCPAGTAINEWYKNDGSSRLTDAEDNYEAAVSDYEVSKTTGYDFVPTAEEMDYTVTRADETIISIRREWRVTGGMPYPSTFCLAEQFDASTGIKLSFADVFTDADVVQERVVDALMEQEEIAAGQFTRAQVIAVYQPEYFYLSQDGYTFWIQGNDLSAIHSPVEVTLPYSAMKDVSLYG